MKCWLPALLASLLLLPSPARAGKLQLADGDRVVLLGNTLIEREQRYGYWELELTRRFPHKNILFRNLGWSGDTVFGEARAGFETAAVGFRRLKDQTLALKPTVIVVGYGFNESFKGPAGLNEFVRGLNTLLDTLAPTKARFVLLSPLRQEDLGRPLPDPAENNKNLRLYRDVIQKVAEKRGYSFIDLFDLVGESSSAKSAAPLTEDEIHLTAYGYWRSAPLFASGFAPAPTPWRVEIDSQGRVQARGTRVVPDPKAPLRFQVTDEALPAPPPPAFAPDKTTPAADQRILKVADLKPGKYVLKIDGRPVVTASAADWAAGVRLGRGPEFDQVERLLRAIRVKNRLFFFRWRPQNETYLFGFRKHEQGKNAREVAEFDPPVARADADIARLRVPATHTYELLRK